MAAEALTTAYTSLRNYLIYSSAKELILGGILFIAWLPVLYYLQIFLHEGGHCLFGLITGYGFLSFRIGVFTLVKEGRRFCIRIYGVAGTAGQCLMKPPKYPRVSCHYVLYIIGGVIADSMLLLCAGALTFCSLKLQPAVRFGSLLTCLYSLSCIIRNAVPRVHAGICNDGTSLYYLLKDEQAVVSFLSQLEIIDRMQSRITYRGLPRKLIQVPKAADLSNEIIAWHKLLEAYYYMDIRKWDRALVCINRLLDSVKQQSCSRLLWNTLQWEKLFLYIKQNRDAQEIDTLYKVTGRILNSKETDLHMVRVQAAYVLYKNRMQESKARVRKLMNRLRCRYPYPGEAAFCISLIRDMLKVS